MAHALGLESVDISSLIPTSDGKIAEQIKATQKSDDDRFSNSPTLKSLLEKSQQNKAKNKKDITDKYCYRQAELGIGDCGGLQFVPGMTENGKQRTPDWLAGLLGVEIPEEAEQFKGKTIKDLIRPDKEEQGIFN
ncbi:hypothetical protein CEUSTIGMA_g4103.t1 [Chlamydomonas eustigma]|uniref:Uncharacterized protein n=1 Tax=Chlamydomonas eustigma TaxID=1157962 RepID=A0A250X0Q7_9CHLO|nr:hypothetical protein CEUSTIGMA_g4103.t1 [Chlamydomonas eustigma]|eukprot:GAX76657.1 hypothetical protein CEUSTIGMA_g4103.t1 [Chlamydomonas eustigma]